MLIDLDTFVILAYAGTILAALVAEFWPRREVARRASLLAVALAVVGGTAWGYAVIKRGYIFYPGENAVASRKNGGDTISFWGGGGKRGGRSVIVDRSGGGEPNFDDGEDAADGGGGSWTSRIVTSALGGGSGASVSLGSLLGGAPKGREPSDVDGDIKKDCEDCPEMLIISAGTSLIGASDNDAAATSAERPQRLVRLWPGFAISRNPISKAQFESARKALDLPERDCGPPPPPEQDHAVCLTASDAGTYADWLTQRSGKRYRLATAIEWEFAARTRGTAAIANAAADPHQAPLPAPPLAGIGQDLSELTADCFDPYVPSEGKERYVWNADPKLCETRVLKGAGVGEERVFARVSARRSWNAQEPRWTVGFRVVRDRH